MLTGKAWTDGEGCTEAGAACVGESFLRGRREVAAKAAGCLYSYTILAFCLLEAAKLSENNEKFILPPVDFEKET